MGTDDRQIHLATAADAGAVARLLHDFNTEFDTPSPGADVLAARLRSLLASPTTFAVLGGRPPLAVALVTLRPNVWYPGPVALLDEMYVAPGRRGQGIGSALVTTLLSTAASRGVGLVEVNVDESDIDAQRFYACHGFGSIEPSTGERAFYLSREPAR